MCVRVMCVFISVFSSVQAQSAVGYVLDDPPQVSLAVEVKVDGSRKPLPILTNVNATVSPGELWVAMGASGSGKSSLLNVIARRIGAECSIGGQVSFILEALLAKN